MGAPRYPKGFFDLQCDFADRVADVSGLALAWALLKYTNFYIRFSLGRGFDPAHPVWQEYLAGLATTNDRREWTYRFYAARPEAAAPPNLVASFGCFSYSRLDRDRIRLHFQNAEPNGEPPLASERVGHRRAELAALFEHIKRTADQPVRVVGASWLYNLEAYRRLFPVSYLASARVLGQRFQHMPLWGQFVNHRQTIKERLARQFRQRLQRVPSLDDLDRCFPFPVLGLEAPAEVFDDFYASEDAR